MSQIHDILRSNTSKFNVELTLMQKSAVEQAMTDYAVLAVLKSRSEESKAVNLEAIKLFPALFVGDWKLWLRKRSFLKACKQAQIRSNIENRKCYVIRSTDIAYTILSTQEVDHNKRIRVLGKDVDSILLTKTADFVTMPKKL